MKYHLPEQIDDAMVREEIALQYGSVETLKLKCLEKIMQLNDGSVLVNLINAINDYLYRDIPAEFQPYTLEELQTRSDEAYEELEAGKGKDGASFFAELNQYVMSR